MNPVIIEYVFQDRSYTTIGGKSRQSFFVCQVIRNNIIISLGWGPSKQEAKREAIFNVPRKKNAALLNQKTSKSSA